MTARAAAALAASVVAGSVLAQGAPDRTKPPVAGPVRPVRFPEVQQLRLSNGLPVLLAERHEVPVANVVLVIRGGSSSEPDDRIGLASLTADMLDEGAGGKDALALADAIDFLGASVGAGSGWDSTSVTLSVPVARLEPALALMADVALRPDFPEKEWDRLKKRALNRLLQARDDGRSVASAALPQAVFGPQHRYGRSTKSAVAALQALRTDDMRSLHARHYRPGYAALVVVGDVTPASLPLFEKAFGSWAKGEPAAPARVAEPPQVGGTRIWLVDRPESAQSVIRIARVGPARSAPGREALLVMNTLLGGSFTSRLNDNLREQHGYAYVAGSGFDQRLVAGLFTAAADVQTQSTAEALGEFMKELRRIRTPASAAEVERARNYMALSYGGNFETTGDVAGALVDQWLHNLPPDTFTTFVPKVLAVGPKELRDAALKSIDPERLAIVIVGDLKKIEAPLRKLNAAPITLMTIEDVMGPARKLD